MFYLFIGRMRFPYVLYTNQTCKDKRSPDFAMVGPIFEKKQAHGTHFLCLTSRQIQGPFGKHRPVPAYGNALSEE